MGDFYIKITKDSKLIYLSNLINKIFKILPLYEKNDSLIPQIYLNGLLININSANQMFDNILIDIMIKLNELNISNLTHKEIRKIILECVNDVVALRENIKKDVI